MIHISGRPHMISVDRADSFTGMKLVSAHMTPFSPVSEIKSGNLRAWLEFPDFLCLSNIKFLYTLR